MKRLGAFHEAFIPLLVDTLGSECYVELRTHFNATISRVHCPRRVGVDLTPQPCDGVEMFAMTTTEFIKEHAPAIAPDFVFIDACHDREAVLSDFCGIYPWVKPEGIIVLHDTNPETRADCDRGACSDAWRAAHEIYSMGIESVTLPFHPGLTIARKRQHFGPAS